MRITVICVLAGTIGAASPFAAAAQQNVIDVGTMYMGVGKRAGRPIRLHFRMRSAKLHAFQFTRR